MLPVPAPQPAPEQAPPTTPDIAPTPIAVAPEASPRPWRNVALILLILVLALVIPGGYIFYQHSQATARQLRVISVAKYGDIELLAQLITAGADVNAADNDGWTPLHWAAYKGHVECVRLLLAAPGIDVNKADKNKKYGWTPLIWAVVKGHVECVRLLLAAPGIDVNKADNNGVTPLKVAEIWGKSECARLIREAGGK